MPRGDVSVIQAGDVFRIAEGNRGGNRGGNPGTRVTSSELRKGIDAGIEAGGISRIQAGDVFRNGTARPG